MKALFKKVHIVYLIVFLAGAVYSAFVLYNLPVNIEKSSGKIDLNVIHEISPVFNQVFLVVGITLLVGVITVIRFFYFLNIAEQEEKIVYVEKTSEDHKKQKEIKEEQAHKNNLKIASEIQATAAGARSPLEKYEKILSGLCMKIEASQGIYYTVKKGKGKKYIEMLSSFAYSIPESKKIRYEFGEGLAGQVAKEGKKINISDVPEGYISIISGLGKSSPRHLAILPVKDKGNVTGVVEIASFKEITPEDEALISEVLKTVKVESAGPEKAARKTAADGKSSDSKKRK